MTTEALILDDVRANVVLIIGSYEQLASYARNNDLDPRDDIVHVTSVRDLQGVRRGSDVYVLSEWVDGRQHRFIQEARARGYNVFWNS